MPSTFVHLECRQKTLDNRIIRELPLKRGDCAIGGSEIFYGGESKSNGGIAAPGSHFEIDQLMPGIKVFRRVLFLPSTFMGLSSSCFVSSSTLEISVNSASSNNETCLIFHDGTSPS